MVEEGANRERTIARTAANQHGVISVAQLRDLGLGSKAASERARRGRLHRVHRGVYAVGHAGLSHHGRWMAAVLAVGRGAVLCHRSAAALWRLMPFLNADVDVTIPGDSGVRKRPGIRVHRSTTLTPRDTTSRLNIPTTTPARTLEDLRNHLDEPSFNAALRQAEVQGLPVANVSIAGREPARSELERRFVRLCRRFRLPLPEVNAPVLGFQADFLWRESRLIAETDGYSSHRGRGAFELDRRRAAALAAGGYEVMRFSWRQVVDEPGAVAAALRARLGPASSS